MIKTASGIELEAFFLQSFVFIRSVYKLHILFKTVGTGALDVPNTTKTVGTGVLDGPNTTKTVGTGVPDGPNYF